MPVGKDIYGAYVNPLTNQQEKVYRYTLRNFNSIVVQVLTYGATISSIRVPNKERGVVDICLGFDRFPGYLTETNPYFGGTIGRVCNRLSYGHFYLDGKEYDVTKNFMKKHTIHGGKYGFDKLLWTEHELRNDGVSLKLVSPDRHEGFPGEVTTIVHFTLTEDNIFKIHYEAETTQACPVNLCNHAYFNLAGHDAGKMALYEHYVKIKASQVIRKDLDSMPTGRYESLNESPLDLRKWTRLGVGIRNLPPIYPGYDDGYCIDIYPPDENDNNNEELLPWVASAWHPGTGILMEVFSDQQFMHFYTSHNMPDVRCGAKPTIIGKNDATYEKHGSFCMETAGYTDAINHDEFPNYVLQPGEKYSHKCHFKFSIAKELPED